jgi:hypothetical protein
MQIKTTLRFHLTLVKWPSSITQATQNAGQDVGKKNTSTLGEKVN